MVTDISAEEGQRAADEVGAWFMELDVASPDAWSHVIDEVLHRYERIDALVNNAGVFARANLFDTDPELYRSVIEVNQVGVYLGMRAVAPTMVDRGSGSIVNVSSIAGLRGAPAAFAYGASKWAVTGMTRSAARTLGPCGVRVNSIHPGMIDTAMMDVVTGADREEYARLASTVPLGRHATADEVAPLVAFLISDESSYCNGSSFVIDGGVLA